MSPEMLRDVLAWCSLVNLVLLTVWGLGFLAARDWMHRLHGRWFRLSNDAFDTVHYAGMAFFKICILVFNLVPYLALRIIG